MRGSISIGTVTVQHVICARQEPREDREGSQNTRRGRNFQYGKSFHLLLLNLIKCYYLLHFRAYSVYSIYEVVELRQKTGNPLQYGLPAV